MEEIQSALPVSTLTEDRKVAFYKKTYTHLAMAVLLFIIVEWAFFQSEAIVQFAFSLTQGWKWLLMLGGFMLATNYAEKMAHTSHDRNKQYIGLGLFVIAEAFIFIPLIGIAMMITENSGGENILQQAAVMTLALFTGLSAVVLLTKKDFSFLRSALTIGGFIAMGLIVAGIFFGGFSLGLWFSVGMVVLASGSILYQTSNMVHKYSEDQYVGASLGLFASLMLLFWYILSILSRD